MLVSKATQDADSVVVSRILAGALLDELASSRDESANRLSVLNMLRLLEMYQYNSFENRQPLGILEWEQYGDPHMGEPTAQVERLKQAFQLAHQKTNPGLSPTDFVNQLGGSLVKLIRTDKAQAKSAQDLERIKLFLRTLHDSLTAA